MCLRNGGEVTLQSTAYQPFYNNLAHTYLLNSDVGVTIVSEGSNITNTINTIEKWTPESGNLTGELPIVVLSPSENSSCETCEAIKDWCEARGYKFILVNPESGEGVGTLQLAISERYEREQEEKKRRGMVEIPDEAAEEPARDSCC
jgi:hypothetical protein